MHITARRASLPDNLAGVPVTPHRRAGPRAGLLYRVRARQTNKRPARNATAKSR